MEKTVFFEMNELGETINLTALLEALNDELGTGKQMELRVKQIIRDVIEQIHVSALIDRQTYQVFTE